MPKARIIRVKLAKDGTMRGRPPKYTPETIAKIRAALEIGATRKWAAIAGNISSETFYDWFKTYPDFSEMVLQAEYVPIAFALSKVKLHACVTEKAALWYLERRGGEDYRERKGIDLTVSEPEVDNAIKEQLRKFGIDGNAGNNAARLGALAASVEDETSSTVDDDQRSAESGGSPETAGGKPE